MKVRNSTGNSIHAYSASLSFRALAASVKDSFHLGDDCGLRFTYEDAEGDVCTVSTEQELRHAVASFVPLPPTAAMPSTHIADGKESAVASVAEPTAPAGAKASQSLRLECVVVPGAGGNKRKKEKTPAAPPQQPREQDTGGTGPLLDPLLIEELDE